MALSLERIINKIRNKVTENDFLEQFRINKSDFTRKRKLDFKDICFMVICSKRRGLYTNIDEYLSEQEIKTVSYSKAAFCKARQKISPEAFKALYLETVKDFYAEENYKTYDGYRVLAIDGSDFNLPNTEETHRVFGSQLTVGAPQSQALCSCLYDVLNEIIIDAALTPQKSNERKLAENHIGFLSSITTGKELLLMDRGYPSTELLQQIENKGFKYLMKVKSNFYKEIRNVKTCDEIIERKIDSENSLKIRVINIHNDNVDATLITNIYDSKFTNKEFFDLYKLRWNIETKYDDLKNKLKIEDFTGTSTLCIKQDFYTTIFLSNIATYLKLDLSKEVEKINSQKNRKNKIQINNARAINEIRANILRLFLSKTNKVFKTLFNKMRKNILATLLPVRPGRSYLHISRHASKFPHNNKMR